MIPIPIPFRVLVQVADACRCPDNPDRLDEAKLIDAWSDIVGASGAPRWNAAKARKLYRQFRRVILDMIARF